MNTSKKASTVIILGSSRNTGNTAKIVDQLIELTKWDTVNLNDYTILNYDYKHTNSNDDFIKLMDRLTNNYETFILATPIYWYSMSGIMKVFLDRFTDLITIKKEIGHRLKQKNIAIIASSSGDNLGDLFWLPFKKTSNYLGIKYITNLHIFEYQISDIELVAFKEKIDCYTKKAI